MTMTSLKEINSDRVGEQLNASVKQGAICFISGPSGVGKDYIAAKAMRNPAAWLYLDDCGSSATGKWIVTLPPTAVNAKVFVGSCDNLEDVMREALRLTKAVKAVLFIVRPTHPLWVAINRLKAVDYKGSNEDWRKGWLVKSKYSPKEFEKYFAKKTVQMISLFKRSMANVDSEVFLVSNSLEGPVRNGWHRSVGNVKRSNDQEAPVISSPSKT